MLYTFFQGIAPRSFGFAAPPDWFDHVATGTLSLVVVLHGGNQDIAAFAENVRIQDLMKGVFHGDEKQKLVAIFPVGLSNERVIGGSWEAGHLGGPTDPLGVDDVSFVFACIDLVDQMLVREIDRLRGLGAALPVVDSAFTPGRRFIMGFSNGAGFVAHVIAGRPGFFRAAAMHSHVFSGWKHAFLQTYQGATPEESIEANAPSPNDPGISLLHLVGDADDRVLPPGGTAFGGSPPDTTEGIDLFAPDINAANFVRLASDYYRIDEAIDDSLALWALSITLAGPSLWTADAFFESRNWLGTYADGSVAAIRQYRVFGRGHKWWFEDDNNNATKLFWDFFQEFAI